jgi:uncharacterized membrane protein YhhN
MFYWLIFILLSAIHLISIELANPIIGFVSKALLMPTLAFIVFKASIQISKIKTQLLLALFFSWLGDLFLSKPDYVFFLLGLASFLTAHIFYILIFTKESKASGELTKVEGTPALIWPFVLYGVALLYLILPKVDDMVIKIAVFLYAGVILTMAAQAYNRMSSVSKKSFIWVFAGAILFVLSDSMIAINKFAVPFDLARMAIMSTYIVAQAFIIKGVLLNVSDNKLVHAF